MIRTTLAPAKGLTAIELLIVISIVALLVAFAAPMIKTMSPKSEFEQAIEITEASVEQARWTARFYKAEVLLRLETDENQKQHAITLSVPKMRKDLVLNEVKERFPLPTGIQIVSEDTVIIFDPNGEVELPAHLLISSNQAGYKSHQLVVK
jgi:prepilin-type N-terminal cleavage/methylation domain-containing protein